MVWRSSVRSFQGVANAFETHKLLAEEMTCQFQLCFYDFAGKTTEASENQRRETDSADRVVKPIRAPGMNTFRCFMSQAYLLFIWRESFL